MLPLAAVERIARKAGIKRISAKAIKELEGIADQIGLELVLEAAQVARYAKRKTILKKDIHLVAGKV